MSQNISKFIQTIGYLGLEIENLVESRVRLYKKMKTKILLTLPPDPRLMEQTILRIHHQLYYWLRFDTKVIDVIIMDKFGWSVERESGAVTPLWFKDILFQSLITFLLDYSNHSILIIQFHFQYHILKPAAFSFKFV